MNIRIVALAIACSMASSACVSSRYYHAWLQVRTSPADRFVGQVPARATEHGSYFRVTTDSTGRVTHVAAITDGQVTQESTYEYPAGMAFPDMERLYIQGALTRVLKYKRNAAGEIIRAESYTTDDTLTAYTQVTWDLEKSETTNYTKDGLAKWRWTTYFSPEGIRIKSVDNIEGHSSYTERIWDAESGQEKSTRALDADGRLDHYDVITYDAGGSIARRDLYNPEGVQYGSSFYTHGLVVKKVFNFSSGHTQETDFQYGANRRAESAEFYRDEKLICTFGYEYLPDGTIKRTIAQGPDGSLWAEYPNRITEAVDSYGHPPHSMVGSIYHRGAWF